MAVRRSRASRESQQRKVATAADQAGKREEASSGLPCRNRYGASTDRLSERRMVTGFHAVIPFATLATRRLYPMTPVLLLSAPSGSRPIPAKFRVFPCLPTGSGAGDSGSRFTGIAEMPDSARLLKAGTLFIRGADTRHQRRSSEAPAPLTLPNLALRDGFRCSYCARGAHQLKPGEFFNRDHVVPRSRGGERSWENLVLSCARCNSAKSCRRPEEAGMTLRARLWVPTRDDLRRLRRRPPEALQHRFRIPTKHRPKGSAA